MIAAEGDQLYCSCSPRLLLLLLLLLQLLLLLLLLQRLKLLRLLLLMKASNLPVHLVLLHHEALACEFELCNDLFGRGLLVAFTLLKECQSVH